MELPVACSLKGAHNQVETMSQDKVRSPVLFAALILCACTQSNQELPQFAARPNEPPFDVAYGYHQQLPVGESDFLLFSSSHGLSYRLSSGEGALDPFIEPPHLKRLDVRKISRTYDIYDRNRSDANHKVHYAAYVDHRGLIVYVENRFLYDGL
jgi:hypothetical protein